jgi:hypothetical protein
MENLLTLEGAVIWIIREGGAAVLAYLAMEHVRMLVELQAAWKRIVAWVLTGVLAIGFYGVAVWVGYAPTPVGNLMWAEVLFATVAWAILGGQGIHTVMQLPKKDRQFVDADSFWV